MNQSLEGLRNVYRDKFDNLSDKFEEFVQMSKLQDIIKKEEKKAQNKKLICAISAFVGVICVVAGVVAVIKFLEKKNEKYDLYDDLDNYYEDDNEEKDFADE